MPAIGHRYYHPVRSSHHTELQEGQTVQELAGKVKIANLLSVG